MCDKTTAKIVNLLPENSRKIRQKVLQEILELVPDNINK